MIILIILFCVLVLIIINKNKKQKVKLQKTEQKNVEQKIEIKNNNTNNIKFQKNKSKENRVLQKEKLKECIKNNFDILYEKYKKSLYKDNCGNYFYDRWYKEIEYFLINTAGPYIGFKENFFNNQSIIDHYTNEFIRYFNRLINERIDNDIKIEKKEKLEEVVEIPLQEKLKVQTEKLKECIEKHFNILYIKYKKSIYKDDYGNEFYDKWFDEINYFLLNVAFPYMSFSIYYANVQEIINRYTKEFNDYFFELLKKQPIDDDLDFEVETGVDYENYIKDVLENFGYNVSTTSTTGDQGVDLIAKKDKSVIAIQCKYYSKPVGNKAVQEVIAGKGFYNCNKAVVISNNLFTKSAKQLADDSNVKLLTIDVGQKIVELDL